MGASILPHSQSPTTIYILTVERATHTVFSHMHTIVSLDVRVTEPDAQIAEEDDHGQELVTAERRALRVARNALTPLCRLPADVLIEIARNLFLPVPFEWTDKLDYNMVNVCSLVRRIIIDTSVLWTYIDLRRGLSWCMLCVQRAGSAALSLSYVLPYYMHLRPNLWSDDRYKQHDRLFVELLPRAAHVRCDVSSHPTNAADVLGPLFGSQWPLLCSLKHRVLWGSPFLDAGFGVFPSLTSLSIECSPLPDPGVDLSALKYLEITRLGRDLSLSQIFRLIHRAPTLRVLSMRLLEPRASHFEAPISSIKGSNTRHLNALHLTIGFIEGELPAHVADEPVLLLLQALPTPRQECCIWFNATTRDRARDAPAYCNRILRTLLPEPAMHVHHVNDELNYTVKFTGRRTGILWTIGIEDCWRPFPFFADSLPSVTTLHLGENTALYAFTNAVGEHGRSALAAVQHVLVKKTQAGFSYLRQWLHLRISIGRRVHMIELCNGSPVHPDP